MKNRHGLATVASGRIDCILQSFAQWFGQFYIIVFRGVGRRQVRDEQPQAFPEERRSNTVECNLIIGLYDETTLLELNLVIDANKVILINQDTMISEEI